MKNILAVLTITVLFLSTGCALWPFGKKSESTSQPTTVDAATLHEDPVKIKDKEYVDAGTFSAKDDYADLTSHGGKGGSVIPSEKFYSVDREKHAPVGKMLYVLTDEDPARCVMAKFTVFKDKKKMMVYSKSQVPTNYCIYQKTLH